MEEAGDPLPTARGSALLSGLPAAAAAGPILGGPPGEGDWPSPDGAAGNLSRAAMPDHCCEGSGGVGGVGGVLPLPRCPSLLARRPSPPGLWAVATSVPRRAARAYLSSPALLALLPLLAGLAAGFALAAALGRGGEAGRRLRRRGRRKRKRKRKQKQKRRQPPGQILGPARKAGPGVRLLAGAAARIGPYLWTAWRRGAGAGTGFESIPPEPGFESDSDSGSDSDSDSMSDLARREEAVRRRLGSSSSSSSLPRERRRRRGKGSGSGIAPGAVPRHVAVIMDGNRRYGRARYGSAARGHWDGSRNLADFASWCIDEGIAILTVYAFSTENWDRNPDEVAALMAIFCRYCDELRGEALAKGIRVRVLSTETGRIPPDVARGLRRMEEDTSGCNRFLMNICLSYGSRGEIAQACRSIAEDVRDGRLAAEDVTEGALGGRLLTADCPDPDLVLRTSGEVRISNFLLWQLAYSEMFFVDKTWPEFTREDLSGIIRSFATGRERRFGR